MRLVFLSDTHRLHEHLSVPAGDVLVHCGDWSTRGFREETEEFLAWLRALPYPHKVVVPGNHDFFCEREPVEARALFERGGVRYLLDEAAEVAGLRFYGSPWTPRFGDWAFMRDPGEALEATWAAVPAGLDVLVTHGPPRGLGDVTRRGSAVGCEALRARVLEVRPRLHVYGHIHEDAGEFEVLGCPTRFLNVASTPMPPVSVRPAVVVDL